MPIYSCGTESGAPSAAPAPLAHAIVSVCEPAPFAERSIAGMERAGPDLAGARHISTRLDATAHPGAVIMNVCGADDRVPVPDATKYPFSAICFLEMTFWDGTAEQSYIGTGFLFSGTAVYTAGHCIHDKTFGLARRIRVYPGRNGAAVPFGVLTSTSFYVPPEWVASHTPDFDYGAILLPSPGFSHTKFFGMESRPADYLANEPVRTAGYPGDMPYATPYMVEGPVASVTANRFAYMLDTMGGQSGSPVFTKNMYGFGNHFALGIHCYGGCPNSATRVIPQVLERLPTKAS